MDWGSETCSTVIRHLWLPVGPLQGTEKTLNAPCSFIPRLFTQQIVEPLSDA
jgi:hypothetical protein